jgi:hypothetical protein
MATKDDKRQAVDVDDEVGTAVVVTVNGELAHDAKIVLGRFVPVDEVDVLEVFTLTPASPFLRLRFAPLRMGEGLVLDIKPAREEVVEIFIALDQTNAFGIGGDANRGFDSIVGEMRIPRAEMAAERVRLHNSIERKVGMLA